VIIPPLAGGHVLCGVEAEDSSITYRSDLSAVAFGAVGLAGVLYHLQSIVLGDLHDRLHIARKAVEVDWDDGLRPLRHRLSDEIWIHVVSLWIYVAEDRP